MARKIPPRRVPRDREQQRAVSSGSIFGGSSIPGAHTHLEADITDLGSYLTLSGGALTGNLTISSVSPRFRLTETDATADEGRWDIVAQGDEFRIRTISDDGSSSIGVMTVTRTGTTVDSVDFESTLLKHNGVDVFLASGGTVTGETSFTFSKTRLTNLDPSLIWTQTGADTDEKTWRITARTNQLRFNTLNDAESVAGNVMIFNRNGSVSTRIDMYATVRILDGSENDFGEFSHDGTDFNLILTNTIDYNITGADVKFGGAVGFNDTAPLAKPTITGDRSSNAALASLLTALASYGLITDSSS